MLSPHFFYGYVTSDICVKTTQITRVETCCRHFMGYSFRVAARDFLHPPSQRNSSVGAPGQMLDSEFLENADYKTLESDSRL